MIGIEYGIHWLPDNSDLFVTVVCTLIFVVAAAIFARAAVNCARALR